MLFVVKSDYYHYSHPPLRLITVVRSARMDRYQGAIITVTQAASCADCLKRPTSFHPTSDVNLARQRQRQPHSQSQPQSIESER